MIGVVIPTLNAAKTLPSAISPLSGLPVWVVDGGSVDGTQALAVELGCTLVTSKPGRGVQLRNGAEAALAEGVGWVLFQHSDTRLQPGWRAEAGHHINTFPKGEKTATFTLQFDDDRAAARAVERWVRHRVDYLGLPYGDQGLLIHRDVYGALGGYRPLPLMEDVDLIRRLKYKNVVRLNAKALTSADRFRRDGFRFRALKNLCLLALFYMGVSPDRLATLYR